MSDRPKITTTHTRTCCITIESRILTQLVTDYALKRAGFYRDATKASLRFEDVILGDPPLKVGTRCIIELTEDQTALPRAEEG